jgi:hypothetical protein
MFLALIPAVLLMTAAPARAVDFTNAYVTWCNADGKGPGTSAYQGCWDYWQLVERIANRDCETRGFDRNTRPGAQCVGDVLDRKRLEQVEDQRRQNQQLELAREQNRVAPAVNGNVYVLPPVRTERRPSQPTTAPPVKPPEPWADKPINAQKKEDPGSDVWRNPLARTPETTR